MNHLVVCRDNTAFYTNWFSNDEVFNPQKMVCIIDLYEDRITFDGITWDEIEEDYL